MSTAQSLLAQADKKANSSGGFFSFGSSSTRHEEAGDLYQGAANAFKLESRWKESGDAFCKAADMALKAGDKDDAATRFYDASKSYKKSHPDLAVMALEKTIALLLERGRFRQAADRKKEVAQIYQQDGSDLQEAMNAYEKAGEWYSSEDANANANAMFKESADLAAQLNNFPHAIRRYEQIATTSLQSPLTRYSVKEYYLKAGLCHLCTGDLVGARQGVENYTHQDPSFAQAREYKFLLAITDAVDANDSETFVAHVQEYDRLSHLDNWKTSILLKVKQTIASDEGLS